MDFDACVRYFNSMGLAAVYVRITYNRKVGYYKTRFLVTKNQVNGNSVKDLKLLSQIIPMIQDWSNQLNQMSFNDVNDILHYLKHGSEISFTKWAGMFIAKMINQGRDNPAINYSTALRSLQKHYGRQEINFSEITSKQINLWVDSMASTKKARVAYPNHIKKMFNDGLVHYNDYDNGVIRIKNEPFRAVKMQKVTPAKKRAMDPQKLAAIFSYNPDKWVKEVVGPLSKDVARIMFALAGINAADLYFMEKDCLRDGKLHYNRRKTSHARDDNAYMEITIPQEIMPLVSKYEGKLRLFSFSDMYRDADDFVKYVNEGLGEICSSLKIEKATTYTFRYSWATIAQNLCGASTELVGFCLNHASAHRITEGYIEKDFSPVDVLNAKVQNTLLTSQPAGYETI